MTEQTVVQTLPLNPWRDFVAAQSIAWRALRRSPILVAITVVSAVLSGILPAFDRGLMMVDGIVGVMLSMRVVYETWAELNNIPRSASCPHTPNTLDPKRDFERVISAYGNGIYYGLAWMIGSLLFIAPGVFMMVAGSLGVIFVCIEEMRAAPAFEASRVLLKGRFWPAFHYLAATTGVFGLGVTFGLFALMFGVETAIEFIAPSSAQNTDLSIPSQIISFGIGLWITWFLMCQTAMQVRLYKRFKEQDGLLVAPAIAK